MGHQIYVTILNEYVGCYWYRGVVEMFESFNLLQIYRLFLDVPCPRLDFWFFSSMFLVPRSLFPVPGCFQANVPCSRLFLGQCSLFPATCSLFLSLFWNVPCSQVIVPSSRLFSGECSLFPAVFRQMFPVPGNPYQSLRPGNHALSVIPSNTCCVGKFCLLLSRRSCDYHSATARFV